MHIELAGARFVIAHGVNHAHGRVAAGQGESDALLRAADIAVEQITGHLDVERPPQFRRQVLDEFGLAGARRARKQQIQPWRIAGHARPIALRQVLFTGSDNTLQLRPALDVQAIFMRAPFPLGLLLPNSDQTLFVSRF